MAWLEIHLCNPLNTCILHTNWDRKSTRKCSLFLCFCLLIQSGMKTLLLNEGRASRNRCLMKRSFILLFVVSSGVLFVLYYMDFSDQSRCRSGGVSAWHVLLICSNFISTIFKVLKLCSLTFFLLLLQTAVLGWPCFDLDKKRNICADSETLHRKTSTLLLADASHSLTVREIKPAILTASIYFHVVGVWVF